MIRHQTNTNNLRKTPMATNCWFCAVDRPVLAETGQTRTFACSVQTTSSSPVCKSRTSQHNLQHYHMPTPIATPIATPTVTPIVHQLWTKQEYLAGIQFFYHWQSNVSSCCCCWDLYYNGLRNNESSESSKNGATNIVSYEFRWHKWLYIVECLLLHAV